jgi:hypothetical protein
MGCKCNTRSEELELREGDIPNDENDVNQNVNKNELNEENNTKENVSENKDENKEEVDNLNGQNFEQNSKKDINISYPEKVVEIINNIRQAPSAFSKVVEESIQNIIENNNVDDQTKNKIIYKQKVKVALTRGEPAFTEAAEILKNTSPRPPLEFSPKLCIPLPDTVEEIKDSGFLKSKILEMRNEGINIDYYFKDLIKIPEVAALLMIVDDNGMKSGKKRLIVLDEELKYIGVNCKFIGKTFVAYFGFSK